MTPAPPPEKPTVLVVEDEPSALRLAVVALTLKGYTPLEAAYAHDAVRVAQSHPGPIDLVLMDMILPDANVRQAMAAVDAVRPGLKVVYTFGYVADDVRPVGRVFLPKPYTLDGLAAAIQEALGRP